MLLDLEFHHIAIATKSINKSIISFQKLGFEISRVSFDKNQNVNVCFLNKQGHPQIELVEPINEKSPVYNIINKSGTTPYHFCYEVDDIMLKIKELKKQSFILIKKPIPAIAFNERKVCFLYNQEVGLIELLERN